jgi:hypothetical protein
MIPPTTHPLLGAGGSDGCTTWHHHQEEASMIAKDRSEERGREEERADQPVASKIVGSRYRAVSSVSFSTPA